MSNYDPDKLAEGIRSGDRRSIARGITLIENQNQGAEELLESIYPDVGQAHRIGVTGPPGSGKSTLITRLAEMLSDRDYSVGIVAVDPSSPFTGGALLGDRVRMNSLRNSDVFIRSMASRGRQGGLAPTTLQVCDLLDAAENDVLIVETVGVGQADVEVSGLVDTTLLVLTPESGDSIQAMKAGLMEIGDYIVINKSDRQGADQVEHEIRSILNMRSGSDRNGESSSGTLPDASGKTEEDGRDVPDRRPGNVTLFQTVANEGEGVPELVETLIERTSEYEGSEIQENRRRVHASNQLEIVWKTELDRVIEEKDAFIEKRNELIERIHQREISPYRAASLLLKSIGLESTRNKDSAIKTVSSRESS